MKYSEFNKKMADFELQYTESDVFIYCDGVMIGRVDRLQRYTMSTYYKLSQFPDVYVAKVFEAMASLAETPLAEREEEKRYRLRLTVPILTGDVKYLNKFKESGIYTISTKEESLARGIQAIFTESEIAQMDITGFEKIEVSND